MIIRALCLRFLLSLCLCVSVVKRTSSLSPHQTHGASLRPKSKIEAAFQKADDSIRNIIHLLEAA